MHEFNTLFTQVKPFHWPGSLALARWNPIPHKYRPARSRRRPKPETSFSGSPPDDITALQRSFNPLDGLRTLRRHRWSLYDVQHLVTAAFIAFSFSMAPIPAWVVLLVVLAYSLLLLMPATRQFFLPSLPIWAYLFYFFSSR